MKEPVREGALGAHHVGVFLRCHALLVCLGGGRAVDFVLEVTVRGALAVGWWAVFVGLWYYRRAGFLLLGCLSAQEFGGEAFGGCMAECGGGVGGELEEGARLRAE